MTRQPRLNPQGGVRPGRSERVADYGPGIVGATGYETDLAD